MRYVWSRSAKDKHCKIHPFFFFVFPLAKWFFITADRQHEKQFEYRKEKRSNTYLFSCLGNQQNDFPQQSDLNCEPEQLNAAQRWGSRPSLFQVGLELLLSSDGRIIRSASRLMFKLQHAPQVTSHLTCLFTSSHDRIVSTKDFVFTTLEICKVRISHDSHTVVFLSVYRLHPPPPTPPPPLPLLPVERTNWQMQCSWNSLLICLNHVLLVTDFLLFVVGDLNIHLDNPSDPGTAALNAVLGNLSLEQLVNVPTHRRGHTLDWLIANRATDVLDLTVADMLLLSHFISGHNIPFS